MEPRRMVDVEIATEEEAVWREVCLFQAAQPHAGIVKLIDVLDDSSHTHLVMELLTGGNLLSRVVQQGGLSEPTVQRIARSVLEGVLHLHEHGICHNDLQPSNVLLDGSDNAKVADFGNGTRVDSISIYAFPSASNTRNNTGISYTAPEVLLGSPATPASDMWSVGVIVFFCLFGRPPFNDKSTGRPVISKIHRAEYSFPMPSDFCKNEEVSRRAKQLISSLLHPDPTVRLTAGEALQHSWLSSPSLSMPLPRTTKEPPDLSYSPSSSSSNTTPRPVFPTVRSLARRLICRPFRRRVQARKETGYPWRSLQSNSTELSVACSSLLAQDPT
jgi:serine/threonine protein kinase